MAMASTVASAFPIRPADFWLLIGRKIMALRRSQLSRLTEPDAFYWATGIEDTFITAPWPATGRTLDEYELTGHYQQWREDIDLIAHLGVQTARYGIPWHLVNPGPDRWDWDRADRPLERLLERKVDPIVDLVHYGVPAWISDAFLSPDYGKRVAEYAHRVGDRFKGRIHWYTPLNEPRITAWYCGKLGWWPPYRRGWKGFVQVMLGLCRGIVLTCQALRDVDPEIVLAHVDATDFFHSPDPSLQEQVILRQHIVFLALDLVSGKLDHNHPLYAWLRQNGASEQALSWFLEHPVSLDLIGLNLYPMFSLKRMVRTSTGLRVQMPYGSGEMLEQIVESYWRHYDAPLMITETAARGQVFRRRRWLDQSVAAMRSLRARGVPLIGYTWWPMFALVSWAYRQGTRPESAYLEQMGLWDLEPDSDGTLQRNETPLVAAYRKLVEGGCEAVGPLQRAPVDQPRG